MNTYIGTDPGLTGAICVLAKNIHEEDYSPKFYDLKEKDGAKIAYREIQLKYPNPIFMIEEQQMRRAQNVKATATTFTGYGHLLGLLDMLDIVPHIVNPKVWEASIGVIFGLDRKERKQMIADLMMRVYPTAEMRGPKGGPLDGRSDALGIADYLMRTEELKLRTHQGKYL